MRIIYCKENRFLSYEALFKFMLRNDYRFIKIRIEEHGVKGREQIISYERVKSILIEEKYNVEEIINNEINKYGIRKSKKES